MCDCPFSHFKNDHSAYIGILSSLWSVILFTCSSHRPLFNMCKNQILFFSNFCVLPCYKSIHVTVYQFNLIWLIDSFIHSFHWNVQNLMIPCHSQELLPYLSVMYFSCHHSPPTILPSSLTSSWNLFLGLPLNLVVLKFIYNTLLGILFSSILCTCPNQRNLREAADK